MVRMESRAMQSRGAPHGDPAKGMTSPSCTLSYVLNVRGATGTVLRKVGRRRPIKSSNGAVCCVPQLHHRLLQSTIFAPSGWAHGRLVAFSKNHWGMLHLHILHFTSFQLDGWSTVLA